MELIQSTAIFYYILFTANLIITLLSAWHALLYKRDPRASLGWIAVIFMFPVFRYILYFLFGINRIRTRARILTGKIPITGFLPLEHASGIVSLPQSLVLLPQGCSEIANIADSITGIPLTSGNRIDILHNGDQAYPSMLDAIEKAERSLFLSTYIFKTDSTGREFIERLTKAKGRGVDVKVIIDGIGEYYSFPVAGMLLKKQRIDFARYIPPALFPPSIHINLRNHRKILVADSKIAFTGGINIGSYNLVNDPFNRKKVIDVHFRIEGPVVSQIEKVFIADWRFITGQNIEAEPYKAADEVGARCRIISEGPDEDFNKLATILTGAISSARKRIMIMTPYFLPNREMISALQTASLKGVEVSILLPEKNNLPYVHWATRNMLWELLIRGVKVYYQPPPFVHTKLFVVDDLYAMIGTANMDARSLRLNFELAVEVYDREFTENISEHIIDRIKISREVTLAEMDSRPIAVRTRDAIAWLFYPYL
ncbi:MAG: cardiolipin synthase [Desulfatiglans sp.]|nr:cardiolipin synthase [Desulfatiglans sp.]